MYLIFLSVPKIYEKMLPDTDLLPANEKSSNYINEGVKNSMINITIENPEYLHILATLSRIVLAGVLAKYVEQPRHYMNISLWSTSLSFMLWIIVKQHVF